MAPAHATAERLPAVGWLNEPLSCSVCWRRAAGIGPLREGGSRAGCCDRGRRRSRRAAESGQAEQDGGDARELGMMPAMGASRGSCGGEGSSVGSPVTAAVQAAAVCC